jgi:HK97 gp10 family phage protein
MPSVIRGSRNSISGSARKAFGIEGLKEIQDKLKTKIDDVTGQKVKDLVYENGVILRDRARANAPYDPGRKKGTHLRDAIFVSRGDPDKADVLVGVRYRVPGAPHAHLVEYGTSKMQARPFFRPAMAQTGQQIASNIKTGLLKILGE